MLTFSKAITRIGFEIPVEAIEARHCFGHEGNGLAQSLIHLCTAEAQKTLSRRSEAFAAQARDAEFIVRAFEQVHGQAMRLNAKTAADRGHVGKCVKCASGPQHFDTL